MTLILETKDETLYEKIKWLLSHFKKDGLSIIEREYVSDEEMEEILKDEELVSSLKKGLEEVKNKEYNFV